jgi:hypothetical protein
MNRKQTGPNARLGLQLEPDLRAAIEVEAERRRAPMSYVVRSLLRAQLEAISGRTDRAVA